MSSSTKIVSFFLFFLLTILQTHARDSQFFNKVSRVREDETSNPINQQNNEPVSATTPVLKEQKKQLDEDNQPNFLPQTTHTGYGLYGHETGIDSPSTTTTTSPATADKSPLYNMDETKYESQNNGNSDMFSYNLDKKNYMPGLSETSYTNNVGPNNYENVDRIYNEKNYVHELTGLDNNENSYTNDNNNNNNNVGRRSNYVANYNDDNTKKDTFNNDEKFDNEKNYVPELTGLDETSYTNNNNNNKNVRPTKYVPQNKNNYNYNNNNKNVGVEKHGMSDTRYMENGKYYFNINSEKDFYPTHTNTDTDTDTDDVFENKNSDRDFYPTNTGTNERVFSNSNYENKNYYNGNGMQKGYKNNQVPKEDEFYFDDQP